jgi:hypothetical protein
MRSMEISLNEALKTGDTHQIYSAIDAAIHAQSNVSQLARSASALLSMTARTIKAR